MSVNTATTTIDVTMGPDVHYANQDALCSAVKEAISQHVRSRESLVRDLNVHATVIDCDCDAGRATFALTLEGRINGKPVSRKFRAARSPDKLRGAAVGTAFGLGGIVNRFVVGLASGVFGIGNEAENLSQCFAECIAEVSLTIDSSVGHQESVSSRAWKIVSSARWVAAAASVAAVTVLFVMRRGSSGFIALFMPGLFIGPSVFFLVHVAGLALMPEDFFLKDPRARRRWRGAASPTSSFCASSVWCLRLCS